MFGLLDIYIAMTGIVAINFSQSSSSWKRKWACIFGLMGQPAWYYTAFMNEQYGILLLTFFYTYSWVKGVKLYWVVGIEKTCCKFTRKALYF